MKLKKCGVSHKFNEKEKLFVQNKEMILMKSNFKSAIHEAMNFEEENMMLFHNLSDESPHFSSFFLNMAECSRRNMTDLRNINPQEVFNSGFNSKLHVPADSIVHGDKSVKPHLNRAKEHLSNNIGHLSHLEDRCNHPELSLIHI